MYSMHDYKCNILLVFFYLNQKKIPTLANFKTLPKKSKKIHEKKLKQEWLKNGVTSLHWKKVMLFFEHGQTKATKKTPKNLI